MNNNQPTNSSNRKMDYIRYGLAGCFLLLVVLVAGGIGLVNYTSLFKLKYLDPFPAYPNAIEVKFIAPLSRESSWSYANCEEAFWADKYQAFATTANTFSEVLAFYENIARNQGLKEYLGTSFEASEIKCFQNSSTNTRQVQPTNVIAILDPDKPAQAKIIKEFGNVPTNMKLILLLQGFTVYP